MKEKTTPPIFYDAKGFTIIGVIMAAGMLGGLALVLAQLSRQQLFLEKRSESALELAALHQRIERTIYDHTACIRTIKKDSTGNPVTLAPGSAVNLRHIKNRNGQNVISKNRTYGNDLIKIISLTLEDTAVTGTTAETNLKVTFEKTSDAITGHNRAVKSYPLSVELNASGRPIGCHSDLNSAIATAGKHLCENIGEYDSATGNCRFSISHQCPTGQVISGFDGDGNPLCHSLPTGNPHPTGESCFLNANYSGPHGVTGSFQPITNALTDSNTLDRWAYCYLEGTTTGATTCVPSVSVIIPNYKQCPPGYTNRYVNPIDYNVTYPNAFSPIAVHFLMEHYCCK